MASYWTVQKFIEEQVVIEHGATIYGQDIDDDIMFFTGLKITKKTNLVNQTHKDLIGDRIWYLSANIRYLTVGGNIEIFAAGGTNMHQRVYIQTNLMNLTLGQFNQYVIDVNGASGVGGSADGTCHHIFRNDTITGQEPTGVEVVSPTSGDTAIIMLDNQIVEFWSYNGSWVYNFTKSSHVQEGVGAPDGSTPTTPIVYVDTSTGNIHVYTGASWVLISFVYYGEFNSESEADTGGVPLGGYYSLSDATGLGGILKIKRT